MTNKNLPAQIIELAESRFDKTNPLFDEYIYICSTNTAEETHFHKHHILPRSMFPEHEKTLLNIVNLTYIDHYRVHEILPNICLYAEDVVKMTTALWMLAHKKDTKEFITADQYSELQTNFKNIQSARRKQYFVDNPDAGKEQSERYKQYYAQKPNARQENSERVKAYFRENPEAVIKRSEDQKKVAQNKEYEAKRTASICSYYKSNPDILKVKSDRHKAWHKNNPDKIREISDKQTKFNYEQCDLVTGSVIKTWHPYDILTSIFSISSIRNVCSGRDKSHKGFFWRKIPYTRGAT